MTKLAVVLCAVLACAAAPSFAADEAGTQGPCKADYQKFCKDVKPGGGRIAACMKEHDADLSAECKEKIAERKEKVQEAKADFDKACGADVKEQCGDVKPGHGAVLKCLKAHKDKVSEGCKDFLKEKKADRKERRAKRKEQSEGAKSDEGDSQE